MPEKSTAIPREFFSIASFGTLSGSAIITWVAAGVCTGILNKFFYVEPALIGLIVAMLVSFAGTYLTAKDSKPKNYLIAFFNGFLIYVTAVGMTSFTPYLIASSPKPEMETSKVESAAPDKAEKNLQAVQTGNAAGQRELKTTGNSQLLLQNRKKAAAILGQAGANIEEARNATGVGASAAALPAKKNFTDAFTKPWITKR